MNSATTRQAWLASAHVALREAGYRAGGAREAILEALAVSDGCLNVQELIAVVSERGASVGTASAYRVLADLERVGVLRRIDLGQGHARHELVIDGGAHHHHVVCDRCGRTDVFDDPVLEAAVHAVEHASDYEVHAHDIVLRGTCVQCLRGRGD